VQSACLLFNDPYNLFNNHTLLVYNFHSLSGQTRLFKILMV
jgi:hypothetical protein